MNKTNRRQQRILGMFARERAVITKMEQMVLALEMGKLYKISWTCRWLDNGRRPYTRGDEECTIGVVCGYNLQSVRIRIYATTDTCKWVNKNRLEKGEEVSDSISYMYINNIEPVPEEELPIYLGAKYQGAALKDFFKNGSLKKPRKRKSATV